MFAKIFYINILLFIRIMRLKLYKKIKNDLSITEAPILHVL